MMMATRMMSTPSCQRKLPKKFNMAVTRANPFRRCQVIGWQRFLYEVAIKPVAQAFACGGKKLFGSQIRIRPRRASPT
jgi:hypothetical protein